MFSAHLVFGDLDRHSSFEFKERASALDVFWNVCDTAKPGGPENYTSSFYDVDNDSLMARFSDFPGLYRGADVLGWTLLLYRELVSHGLYASFGVDLLALNQPVSWPTQLGFANDSRRMFIRDDLYCGNGVIPRSRIVGDALIITARLVSLAKASNCPIVFSAYQGGNILEGLGSLESTLDRIRLVELTSKLDLIGDNSSDLAMRQVKAYGIKDLFSHPAESSPK
jgi:hypothetical protein